MADYWTDFYRSVGIGAPEFTDSPQMTPEEMYEGIYGEPLGGLSTRSAKSVPVNPSTGMPYATTADAKVKYGAGIGAGAKGEVDYWAPGKVRQPNTTPGPDPVPKYQERLPALPAGLPIQDPGKIGLPVNMPHRVAGEPFNTFSDLDFKGSGPFKGDYTGSMRFASAPQTAPKATPKAAPDYRGYTASMRFASPSSSSNVVTLADEPASDLSGQKIADNLGKAVKTPGGKIYQPKQAPLPKVAPKTGGGLGGLGGGLGGLGALLGGLFGGGQGGQQQPQGGGLAGLLAGMNGGAAPAPTYTTTPFQEDRFQTTTGAQMPGSMANSRWTTGY